MTCVTNVTDVTEVFAPTFTRARVCAGVSLTVPLVTSVTSVTPFDGKTSPVFETRAAEAIFNLRWTHLGLSQVAFGRRFGIPYSTVQNIEQGRGQPKPLARLVLAAIEMDPDLMARAATAVRSASSHTQEE